MQISTPLKWHGGKSYLAKRIVALMPPRQSAEHPEGYLHYVEPYAGGLSVLLANDPEGISEVANDLNGALTNFWCVLRDPRQFDQLLQMCQFTPFSEYEWQRAQRVLEAPGGDYSDIECAHAFLVHCRQSLAGRMQNFAPLSRKRTRRGMNEQASAWLSCIEGLPAVHARLKRVVILDARPALDVIRQQDDASTLFYLDPSYLHETRATTGEYGDHEMTREAHADLLDTLKQIRGKFLLSGYRSDLYDQVADEQHWTRHEFALPNNAASGGTKRRMLECVWCNF